MLKTVTIDVDIPDGYELVRYGFPKPGEQFFWNGRVETAIINFTSDRHGIIRKPEPIPEGTYWCDTANCFVHSDGVEYFFTNDAETSKWLRRRAEFPKYEPPKMLPLGPEDIVPGTGVHIKALPDYTWEPVRPSVCGNGVVFIEVDRFKSFADLQKSGDSYKTPSMPNFAKCEKVSQ